MLDMQLRSSAHRLRLDRIDQSIVLDFESPSSLIAQTDIKVTHASDRGHSFITSRLREGVGGLVDAYISMGKKL